MYQVQQWIKSLDSLIFTKTIQTLIQPHYAIFVEILGESSKLTGMCWLQGYRKFETFQYNRILNLELSNETREISRHFDKVSKLSKICLYTLQDNLEQYNHPSRPFYCSSILLSALGFFFCSFL